MFFSAADLSFLSAPLLLLFFYHKMRFYLHHSKQRKQSGSQTPFFCGALCFLLGGDYQFHSAQNMATNVRQMGAGGPTAFHLKLGFAGLILERAEVAMCNAGFGFTHGGLGPAP